MKMAQGRSIREAITRLMDGRQAIYCLILLLVCAGVSVGCSDDDSSPSPPSDEVRLAVAADFAETALRLGDEFTTFTGNTVTMTSASSGELVSQIRSGAQFDSFLSANTEFPQQLVEEGLAVGDPVVYAIGTLALYSKGQDLSEDGESLLVSGAFERLALADPAEAPYGLAAIQTLENLGVREKLESTLVVADNVAAALMLVESGDVDAGFVAFPDLGASAAVYAWVVPEDLHDPIQQAAVLLSAAQGREPAVQWMTYLLSASAGEIIRAAGYRLP
jgi:molybdate transport system substrate-binding protein